ncbi:MAG: type II toxin-antitoxin system prevent-host-death family antitoxin [Acetobacteraceae bacterium]
MREIQASDAKARFAELLTDVERGETVVVTRHGRPIARIVPDEDQRQKEIDEAREVIKKLRRHSGRVSTEEILAWRHEGHKY